jgi:outer membrane protein insertion porin family
MKHLVRHGGLWVLLFFCSLSAASAQSGVSVVSQIVITNIGPAAASDDLVRANIHIKAGDTYIPTSVDDDVRALYTTGFFENIRVVHRFTDQGVVLIYFLEGKLKLTGISFEGNTKYTAAKLKKKVTSKIGDPLDEQKLFSDCQEIEKMYEKAGYSHTVVKYERVNVDQATGRGGVLFVIKETPKIKIADIVFTGANAFTQYKLRKVITTGRYWWIFRWINFHRVFKEDVFEDDKDALTEFYQNAGFIDFEIRDIKITKPVPNRMKIEFVIFEGSKYKVGSVTFTGNKLFPTDQLVKGLSDQHHSKTNIGPHGLEADVGLTFTPVALGHDVKAIENFYWSRGYIDVREYGPHLRIKKIPNTQTGTMDLEYIIDEGEKSYIAKIDIKGNVKTKDKVIRRELSVSPGDIFNNVLVENSKLRLEGMEFFEKVDTKSEPTDSPNRKNLVIAVDEKSTGQLSVGAGFSTVESFSVFGEVLQRNFDLFHPPYFTGAGQKFRLAVQVGLRVQDYEISFTEPWFLNRKLQLDVDLFHRDDSHLSLNSLYNISRTGAHVGLSRALFGDENFRGSIGYTIEQIGINNVNTNAPDEILADNGSLLFSHFTAALSYDTRNNYQLANKGQITRLTSEITVGQRDYYKLGIESSWFFKGFGEGQVLEIGGKAGVAQKLSGGEIPVYERYYLGGTDLRGFDVRGVGPRAVTQDGAGYEPIGGDTFWLASAEYSFSLIPSLEDRLRLAFFYDIGNVSERPWSNSGFNVVGKTNLDPFGPGSTFQNFAAGSTRSFSDAYGIGLRINIPRLGPLRLDYGIPIHHDPFNSSSGKFQFGVGFRRLL